MRPLAALAAACLLLACSDDTEDTQASPTPTLPPGGSCQATEQPHPIVPSPHVTECSKLTLEDYSSNPPSSGSHYATWAAFKTYTAPMPRGYYLHSLEHGAVAFFYNCPEGCADEVATLQAIIDQLPTDPLCSTPGGPVRRLLLLPEPSLPSRFAAAAWGYTLTASCVDSISFDAFARKHYAKAAENFCNDGVDIVARGVEPLCGQ